MSELFHVGVGHEDDPPGRGSGRYAYGSGANPHQHQFDFLSEVDSLSKKGLSQAEIAKALLGEKAKAIDLRAKISIEKNKRDRFNHERAAKLLEKYNGNKSAVAREMGVSESTIRSYLDPLHANRLDKYQSTADMIKKRVDEKGIVDISSGSEIWMGCSDYTKKVAVQILRDEGYVKSYVDIEQQGTGKMTSTMVLAKPGMTYGEIQKNKYEIAPIVDFTPDEGKTWWTPEFPTSLNSKRVKVRYAEEGGIDRDGVIEIRKGVEDLSLGGSQYAQVRIAVDGTHYLKGMAMYGLDDEFPPGVDIIFNTNKHTGTPMIGEKDHEVLKRLKIDKETGEVDRDNPFGASIKSPKDRDGLLIAGGQRHYIDKDGKEKLSPINKLQDEGDWNEWSKKLSSQFLAKQPLKLINQQIKLSVADRKNELAQIQALTNKVIKKKMLEDFASSCDSNAADLKVRGFKNQTFQVILPLPSLKQNEIYAPNFKDGDTVALIRYPHAGPFETPVLKVNNRNKDAKTVFEGGLKDAVAIHPKVAEQLSGADFDGDTVTVIPLSSNHMNVIHRDYLPQLKGFDAKEMYKLPDDAPRMNPQTKQTEMGKITNLITDMTAAGADYDKIARAVKHSMVVIDAEKHHLDYKQSAKDQNIAALKKEFQGSEKSGAKTIFSKADAKVWVDKRNEKTRTSEMTPEELKRWNEGKIVYRTTEKTKASWKLIKDPKKMTPEELQVYNAGKKVFRYQGERTPQEKVSRMYLVDDARDLVFNKDNAKEMAYADYANELKGLANQARKEARSIKPDPINPSSAKTYAEEVASLKEKLTLASSNAPRERIAQNLAGKLASEKFKSNPDLDNEHKSKIRNQMLVRARAIVGAHREPIEITDREWDAIQANAITSSKLEKILLFTDQDKFKERATPKRKPGSGLTKSELALAKAMYSSGMYTQKEIAEKFGVSVSIVTKSLSS